MPSTHRTHSLFLAAIASLASFAFVGCALNPATSSTGSSPLQISALHGVVHGGQQAVTGSTIQLYAAGSTGYGSPFPYSTGTSLLGNNVVTTGAGGSFSLAGTVTCPTPSTPVYIVATGGNPGLTAGTNNTALAMMAALGPCGGLNSSTNIVINELTTIGSVWALSPFMTGIANIGTSSTNAQGLVNAFAAVNKLVNTSDGTLPGAALPAGATLPSAKINTLANIIASCINSASGSSSACAQLFTDTTVAGVTPTDTITAAMVIAQNPNLNTADLTTLSTPSAPFQPTVANPSDYSLTLTYTGGAQSAAKGIAMDAAGNAWLPNSTSNSITKLTNTGTATNITTGSLNAPAAIAIDSSSNIWVTNSGNNTVSELNPAATFATIYSGGGLSTPGAIAIDAANNAWIANPGNNSITQISATAVLTNFSGNGISAPTAIAINPK